MLRCFDHPVELRLLAASAVVAAARQAPHGWGDTTIVDEVCHRLVVGDGHLPWALWEAMRSLTSSGYSSTYVGIAEPFAELRSGLLWTGRDSAEVPGYLRWDYPAWAAKFSAGEDG